MRRNWVLGCGAAVLLVVALAPRACTTAKPMPLAATAPVAQTAPACMDCHKEHARLWRDGGHREISCQTCHGRGTDHAMATAQPGQPRPKMPSTGGTSACLGCHQQFKSFEEHVQAVEKKHVMKANVERAQGQCVYCHDPHSLQ